MASTLTKTIKGEEDIEFEKKIILTEEANEDEDMNEDDDSDKEDEFNDDDYEIDTVISIFKDIKEFVGELSLPLCEKLTWGDIQFFINNELKVVSEKIVYDQLDA